MTDSPLDDVRDLIMRMPDLGLASEINPDGSLSHSRLGRLERIGHWLAASQRKDIPEMEKTTLALFAGSHGLEKYGVSISPENTTERRIEQLRTGKLATNGVAADARTNVKVFELALEQPTHDISTEAAMSEVECAQTIAYGMESVADTPHCLSLGVLGRGGGTAAAAVAAGLYGGDAKYWVRAGFGTPEEINLARAAVVDRAIERHRGHMKNPLEVLRRLGGRELAACAGAIIAARHQGVPVLLDGFATCVAAGVVHSINPAGLDHVMAAHISDRPSHKAILERINLDPIYDLQLQIGEGFGSVLAISVLRAASITKRIQVEAGN